MRADTQFSPFTHSQIKAFGPGGGQPWSCLVEGAPVDRGVAVAGSVGHAVRSAKHGSVGHAANAVHHATADAGAVAASHLRVVGVALVRNLGVVAVVVVGDVLDVLGAAVGQVDGVVALHVTGAVRLLLLVEHGSVVRVVDGVLVVERPRLGVVVGVAAMNTMHGTACVHDTQSTAGAQVSAAEATDGGVAHHGAVAYEADAVADQAGGGGGGHQSGQDSDTHGGAVGAVWDGDSS